MKPVTKREWRELCAKHASREFKQRIHPEGLLAHQGKWDSLTEWRFYAMAILQAHGFSMPRTAAILGFSDHTSILHGLRRAHGHDGKGIAVKKEPLWKREHFEKIALGDEAEFLGVAWRAA